MPGSARDYSMLLSNNAGTGGAYRIDRADDLDWLYGVFGEHLP